MNAGLDQLAARLDLGHARNEGLRLRFGHACAQRVRHFLEDPAVVSCLDALGACLDGQADRRVLDGVAREAAALANRHPGSRSLDGCGHAAVSATYAVANAVSGKALAAASYAAYARVYGEGGHGAVADPASFEDEFRWQADCLAALAEREPR